MFELFQKWSLRMAEKLKDAVKGRLRELPRVRLIPVVDPLSDSIQRRKEVQLVLAMMFANLHKRGRPKNGGGQETDNAA